MKTLKQSDFQAKTTLAPPHVIVHNATDALALFINHMDTGNMAIVVERQSELFVLKRVSPNPKYIKALLGVYSLTLVVKSGKVPVGDVETFLHHAEELGGVSCLNSTSGT